MKPPLGIGQRYVPLRVISFPMLVRHPGGNLMKSDDPTSRHLVAQMPVGQNGLAIFRNQCLKYYENTWHVSLCHWILEVDKICESFGGLNTWPMYSRVADKVSPRWYIHLDQCAGCAWNRCNCAHRSSSAEYPNHRTRRHQAQWIPAVTTCHHSVCRHLPHQTMERGFKHVQTVIKPSEVQCPPNIGPPSNTQQDFLRGMSYWGLSDQWRLSSPPTCWCIGNEALGLKFTTVVALATSPPTLAVSRRSNQTVGPCPKVAASKKILDFHVICVISVWYLRDICVISVWSVCICSSLVSCQQNLVYISLSQGSRGRPQTPSNCTSHTTSYNLTVPHIKKTHIICWSSIISIMCNNHPTINKHHDRPFPGLSIILRRTPPAPVSTQSIESVFTRPWIIYEFHVATIINFERLK